MYVFRFPLDTFTLRFYIIDIVLDWYICKSRMLIIYIVKIGWSWCINKRINSKYLSFLIMNPNMQHLFTCIVSGPTGGGKSVFSLKLIRHAEQVITPPPERIIYCYGEYQKVFDNYFNVEFHDGLPDLYDFDGKSRTLLVLDDLMTSTDGRVVDLFTKISHHRSLSVVYLTQNTFLQKQTIENAKFKLTLPDLVQNRSRCITSC